MNLILITAKDRLDGSTVRLSGRRFEHIRSVHQAQTGEQLKVGELGGMMGRGSILKFADNSVEMEVTFDQPAPLPLPLTLLLALPRPKMLRRVFQTCATLGVRDIILINAYRVEKSYWQSPHLHPERIREQLILGLEQGVATHLPKVQQVKRFKPFVEDELPALCRDIRALVAHPYGDTVQPQINDHPTLLAIGPEGGFIPYEIEKLREAGLTPLQLGQRIMRVETALPYAIAKLF